MASTAQNMFAKLVADEFHLTAAAAEDSLTNAYKRYRSPAMRDTSSPVQETHSSISLILIHCINTHKETYEPVIERLFELQRSSGAKVDLVEVWVMDSPNHGRAAVLNDAKLLKSGKGVSSYTVADGLHQLVKSGLLKGNKIVAAGHSAGAGCVVLSTKAFPLDHIPYASIILLEPHMMPRHIVKWMQKNKGSQPTPLQVLAESAKTRKDTWPSREAAQQWFAKRYPWKLWDQRALRLFVDHGLRDMPTATYPDTSGGVTLACTREQEAAGYAYTDDGIAALDRLSDICPVLPVHAVFGSRKDVVLDETRAAMLDVQAGRKMTSISTVQDAGHLLVQEKPRETADTIWKILEQSVKRESKL